ncbi:hypothetical protein [Bordetella genomosp. 4]|uniref:Uncharacterized protein n=1 Tax=Bordetella genomosp. 4 TaxID=463044 RepID=A0A261TMR0_9BORD|nr:hypothetical protein [Bordetella genomosp. 4]OZI42918.1 hypothetical protein CAL21_19040 [Bordetella genomosp. 4]OZI50482.1 hypothetical protein CAL20_21730 [Bordetella genomosp. 4]
MAEVYEIVLEEVPRRSLLPLLKSLEAKAGTFVDLTVSEPLGALAGTEITNELIDAVIDCQDTICIMGRICYLEIFGDKCLKDVFLRVIKYNGGIDVELSFEDSGYSDIEAVMLAMQRYVSSLAEQFRIPVFYGGLEPAVDLDTRYFTNDVFRYNRTS